MTDLEDLWNSLPAGEPPTARILQQARSRSRHRTWRVARRPLLVAGAMGALGATFVAGTLVPGGTGGGPGSPSPRPAVMIPVAFHADLAPASSCDALLATYIDRGLGVVTADGWRSPVMSWDGVSWSSASKAGGPQGVDGFSFLVRGPVPLTSALTDLGKDLSTGRVTASDSGTNVQEAGVDEPDAVKTDGHLLVRLRNSDLLTYDVTGSEVRLLSTLHLDGLDGGEILLTGDTVVVLGPDEQSPRSTLTRRRTGTRVQTVSLADPSAPVVTDDVSYDAAITAARQHGDTIRMVLSTGLPDLPFVRPGASLTASEALAKNRAIVKRSTLSQWLPGFDTGDGRQDLLGCRNVGIPPANIGLDTVAVATFAAASPSTPSAFGLAGATTIAYESADRLYLASTPASSWNGWACVGCGVPYDADGPRGTSYLFEFRLTDDRAVQVASGEVEGTIRDRWSMDEHQGQLRVLVGPSTETGDFNSIVTFRRDGSTLVESGRLDRIGPREQIRSVRWQDDLAIVVTFRQTDPLYVVDLRGTPKVVSELRVPGYSSYLHPLGSDRLIGVGYGPDGHAWGAQMGLFGVKDLTRVRQLDVTHYGRGSSPVAAKDPRAFTWLPKDRTVLTVIQRGRVGWLSIDRLSGNQLHNRMLQVEYGDDIAQVRTIGMPDGRVVLVTGEEVSFLDL